MMSGFEVIGAVVSIAQLGAYILTVSSKLHEVRCKIRNAPKKLERYDRQLKELVDITKQMVENPPIRTKELNDYLKTIVDKTKAIEGILTKFTQSSGSRRRWNIIRGELWRQLDENFEDVKNTMGNLVVLIASQSVHGQKELKELVLECTRIASAPTQASAASPELRRTDSNFAPIECVRRKAGSHSFRGLTIKDNGTVSMGNVSTSQSTLPYMAGHLFTDFTASGNKVLHLGNAGMNSEGHAFDVGVMEKNGVTMLGDYVDMSQKYRDVSLQRGSAISHIHQVT